MMLAQVNFDKARRHSWEGPRPKTDNQPAFRVWPWFWKMIPITFRMLSTTLTYPSACRDAWEHQLWSAGKFWRKRMSGCIVYSLFNKLNFFQSNVAVRTKIDLVSWRRSPDEEVTRVIRFIGHIRFHDQALMAFLSLLKPQVIPFRSFFLTTLWFAWLSIRSH